MWSFPGKKLLFMGTEFGQRREFSESRSIDWEESAHWGHQGVQRLVKDMNAIYKETPALYKLDSDPAGFSWISADDAGGNVFSFVRYDGDGQMIASVVNFSSEPRQDYRIGLPTDGVWSEILNTDSPVYHGSGQAGNLGQVIASTIPSHGYPASAHVTIPPLGAVWLKHELEPDPDQPEPDKVAAGALAAAKAASPHPSVDIDPDDMLEASSTDQSARASLEVEHASAEPGAAPGATAPAGASAAAPSASKPATAPSKSKPATGPTPSGPPAGS
jgi:1,4-alpha-glucan branching enzyme